MTQSELSHMAGAVDECTINIVVVIIIITIKYSMNEVMCTPIFVRETSGY